MGLVPSRLIAANQGRKVGSFRPGAKCKKFLAVSRNYNILGRPSSRAAVESGLFPIPPERLVILGQPGRHRATGCTGPGYQQAPLLLPDQRRGQGQADLDRVAQIARILATYYGLPERQEGWAETIAKYDPLEPPNSCALVFLDDLHKHGGSPLIHWWMFVTDEGNRDLEEQLHITLVHASSGFDSGIVYLVWLYLTHIMYRAHVYQKKFGQITSMDHLKATRFVNDQMVKALQGIPPTGEPWSVVKHN